MRKLIAILPVVMLIGAMTATSAFAVSDTVTVSASVAQASLISIAVKDAATAGLDLTTIGFGTVPNTASDHRTKNTSPTAGAWVDYFVGAGTHEIRVWFDNYPTITSDPTKATAGLSTLVAATTYYWPLKIWHPNLGPAGATAGPDPDIDANWKGVDALGTDTRYAWIFEKAYKVDGFGNTGLPAGYTSGTYKDETRTKLAWYYPAGTAKRPGTALDARLPSRFRVDLGIDALDAQYAVATATNYSGVLTFNLEQAP